MKIGIDISQIVYPGSGVSRFLNGLVKAIITYDQQNQWLFFFSSLRGQLDKNLEKSINNHGHQLLKWKLPPTFLSLLCNDFHQFSRYFMFQASRFTSLDWFITSDWTEPFIPIKKATVVHDLVYWRYPETVAKKILQTQIKRMRWVKKESKIIFADSQTTKEDLINYLKIDFNRIHVNYPGVDIKKPLEIEIKKTLNKYKITKPFILTVGKIEPRKNLTRLIQAFNQLQRKDIDLVIVGCQGWDVSINRLIDKSKQNIQFLGFVEDNELYAFYSSCLFFTYPSIWEGFGYPLIEAMKLTVPVTCSNNSSLKEIVQEAALLFDPFDIKSIKNALILMINDEKLRKKIAQEGLEISKHYTWKMYYKKMIKTLSFYC